MKAKQNFSLIKVNCLNSGAYTNQVACGEFFSQIPQPNNLYMCSEENKYSTLNLVKSSECVLIQKYPLIFIIDLRNYILKEASYHNNNATPKKYEAVGRKRRDQLMEE